MNTRLGSKRWLGVTLLFALLSLFTVADLQAKDARPRDVVPIGTCDVGEPDADPWMVGAEPIAPCPGYELSEVQSVYLLGDYGLMRVLVGDKVESHVYQRTDAGWEWIYVLSTDDGEWDYLTELENASAGETQDVELAPRPAVRSSNSTWAVQGKAYEAYMRELEDASAGETQDVGPFIRSSNNTWAVQGEAYEAYLRELEDASAGETQDVGLSIRSSKSAQSVEVGAAAIDQLERETDHFGEGGAGWEPMQFAPVGDAYWEYVSELETSETDR